MSHPQMPGRERRSLRWRWWLIVLLLVLPPVIALLAFTNWRAGVREEVQAEIERIKAAGEPTTIEEVIPVVPIGGNNAAEVYQQAFSSLQIVPGEEPKLTTRLWPSRLETGETLVATRGFVARNESYFTLLERAAGMPECVFPVDWYAWPNTRPPPHAEMKQAARMLGIRALLLAGEGKGEKALASLRLVLRTSEHAQSDGTLEGAMVGWEILERARWLSQDVLSATTPSAAACREMFEELDRLDPQRALERALRITRVVAGIAGTSPLRRGGFPDKRRRSHTVFALTWQCDQLAYLRSMRRQIDAISLPWPQSRDELEAAKRELSEENVVCALLSGIGGTSPPRATEARERARACVAASQIALALTAYRAEKGRYPDDLQALRAAGWDLPMDPFTQQDFRHRREEEGFVVWSLGPNMADEGGEYRSPLNAPAATPDDVSFRCSR